MLRFLALSLVLSCALTMKAQSNENLPTAQPKVRVEMSESVHNLLYLYKAKAKKYPHIAGFRIQIFNGRKNDCLERRGLFLRDYPQMQAYLLYEVPEYKTQVGNFRSRLEAEAFLQSIIEAFPGSFVVATQIDYPKID